MNFQLDHSTLNRLFPFHFIINDNLVVESIGKSMAKILAFQQGNTFNELFRLLRPIANINTQKDLLSLLNEILILKLNHNDKLLFRGQFEFFVDSNHILFFGSPWFENIEELNTNNLVINDFARHDPLIDLLHVKKTQEIYNDDLKQLVATINRQKNELKVVNREINDLALFTTQSPDPILRINIKGELLKNNPAASNLDFFEFEGQNYKNDLFFKLIVNKIDFKQANWTFEARSNGSDYSFLFIVMEENNYINIFGRNITQEKISAAKIKENDEKLKLALQKIGDNVWEHDLITGKTYFSKSTNKELSSNLNAWWESVYKDDLPLLIENDRKYKNGEIESHNLEYRIVLNDGSIKWVLDRGVLVVKDANGKPLKIIGTNTDITGRKSIEERLEKQRQFYEDILNNMPADIAVFSAKHEYQFVNLRAIKDDELRKWILGKRDEDYCEFRNKPMSIAAGRRKIFNKVIASKQPYEWEEKNIAPNGEEKYALRIFYPVIENDNKVKLVIGYGIDITEIKKTEQALIKSREQAEQLTQAKENFLANMSHEIRTPMNAIMGMTNQLFRTLLSEKQSFYLETIRLASDNLLVIINDILDVAKIEAGKLSIEKIAFEPKKVLGHVKKVMLHKAEEKGLSFTNAICDPMLSQVLIGDPYRINQILLNLVSNAIKFTEKGEVDISWEVVNSTPITQDVKISVKDTGVGMDESFSKSIFEKFKQEDESISRKFGGTGLGMSICKDLVELMGGQIEVKSKKGKGTKVSFTIPFEKAKKKHLEVKSPEKIDYNVLKGKIILIADDNEMNRLVATTILSNYGVKTIEVSNGKQAVEVIKNTEIDIVLMDIQMPVMDGIEATQIIRNQIKFQKPIIALTALAVKGDKEKILNSGMNDYVSKPFKEELVVATIAKYLFSKPEEIEEKNKKPISIKQSLLYNLDYLHKIAGDDDKFIDKMVNLFAHLTPIAIEEIKNAYANNDLYTVSKAAHRIKTSIDNLGIVILKDTISDIELNAQNYGKGEKLTLLIDYLETKLIEVFNQLKERK